MRPVYRALQPMLLLPRRPLMDDVDGADLAAIGVALFYQVACSVIDLHVEVLGLGVKAVVSLPTRRGKRSGISVHCSQTLLN